MNHHPPELTTLLQKVQWGQERGAFRSRVGHAVANAVYLGMDDKVTRDLVDNEIRRLRQQEFMGTLPPFKAGRFNARQLCVGNDIHGGPLYLLYSWLLSGLLLISNTGGGKSNWLSFLALQLATVCPFWFSESYKNQLRLLRPLLQRLGIDLIIINGRDWRWNLLQPHIRDTRLHLTMVVDLLVRVLDLPPRGRSILARGLHELYRRHGVWNGNRDNYPTLIELFEFVRVTQGLNPQARDAILDRLASLILALTPRCAAFRVGWSPSDLIRHHIVFEMRGSSETAKQILLGSLLFSVFYQEVERGVVNSPLIKGVICFDDSQRFFDAGAQGGSGELAPMDELAGVIRGTGISLWVLAQTAAGLSRRLIPNLGNKFIGRLGSHEDYASMGADMGMAAEQIDWARLHLQPGQFIGQVTHEWREPFVFQVPLLKFTELVSDAEATASMRALDNLPTVFAEEFAGWQPQYTMDLSEKSPAAAAPVKPVLDEAAIRFLKAVVQNPGQPSSTYARIARLGTKQAVEIRNRLVDAGYLREHPVATGARGRQSIVLEPTPSAYAAVTATGGES